jgi:hypothetical protein
MATFKSARMWRVPFKILEASVSGCYNYKQNLFVCAWLQNTMHCIHSKSATVKYVKIFEPGKDIHPSLLPIINHH